MARDVVSHPSNAAGQIGKLKPWFAWKVGAAALLALVMMLAAGCSSSSPQSDSEVGTTEVAVVETSSTSSTVQEVQSEVTPTDVTTTAGGQDPRSQSATAQPEQAPAQDSQPRVTSAPTTQYVPPTTQYVCVPDSSAMSGLESDYRYNQYLYNEAYSDLARRNLLHSGMMVRLQTTGSENAAEYERARGAINSCQDTYWYFLTY
jgi:hypothetical protein